VSKLASNSGRSSRPGSAGGAVRPSQPSGTALRRGGSGGAGSSDGGRAAGGRAGGGVHGGGGSGAGASGGLGDFAASTAAKIKMFEEGTYNLDSDLGALTGQGGALGLAEQAGGAVG
jgi:hypothetical protein